MRRRANVSERRGSIVVPGHRGRPAKWIPNALVTVRARDPETAEAVGRILSDALSSHPDDLHVLVDIGGAELSEDDCRALADLTRLERKSM